MSRIANAPVTLPSGVEVTLDGQRVKVKGSKGELEWNVHELVTVEQEDAQVKVSANDSSKQAVALAGTTRALVNNMVTGVTAGFEKKLTIVGVGYRAQAQGQKLNLTLGFSHPVVYEVPEGIKVETPSNTEIVVTGIDKQVVGQVAAEIRAYRKPEPYKGKGVRYADEYVMRKQAKKK
ncbi:50S ribosomal protein L6 [Arenicella chitinivorans]|uniref:Large ribosomal subunit protein uL6 n=1 Tax=Arenicella chitinivorans TaxID=1329800 RepID=A0A918RR19_9GAMM|nr:50S ribosomal protein L6 [Arenicella chitinivorans]GHA05568.1 50S ribosomal protein L6 [Arenicella chitinivorans]